MLGILKKKERPTYTTLIQNLGKTVSVKYKQTLLDAALEAGIDFPFSCGAGCCTTCKCKLIEGEYKDLSDMSLVLSNDDLKKGFILACQTLPQSNMMLALKKTRRGIILVR